MLKLKNISCGYRNNTIIKNLSVEIPSNSFVSIIGINGSGKTTLLKAINQSIKYKGSVELNGVNLNEKNDLENAKMIATLGQKSYDASMYSVDETVLTGRFPHIAKGVLRKYSENDKQIVKDILEKFELTDIKDKKLNELSGGQTQRVLLARTIAQEPKLLLLDEPTNHLDIKHQIDLMDYCNEYKTENDNIVVAVLHDLGLALRHSDYILAIKDGEAVFYGNVEEFKNSNKDKFFDIFGVEYSKWAKS